MKIRTITVGISELPTPQIMKWVGEQLDHLEAHFSSQGYSIQTRRLALSRWDVGIGPMPEARKADLLEMIDSSCLKERITFCSIGVSAAPDEIEQMGPLLIRFPRLSVCADGFRQNEGLSQESINAAANTIVYLANHSDDSFGNFRFGVGFCMKPGNPFFPGAYHEEAEPSFAIGVENSDLLVEAFSNVQGLEAARDSLYTTLNLQYRLIQEAALDLAAKLRLSFGGIDTSIAPSANAEESIVRAFDNLGTEFGKQGTLAICGMITDVLKSLPVKRVGYCGIMLPVLEDAGLAKAVEEDQVGITELLAYSSVCGTGVDMVPLPGDVNLNKLQALMLDVGTMALKLRKPLLVRVLPVLNKRAGDRTEFDSPYICNSKVMAL